MKFQFNTFNHQQVKKTRPSMGPKGTVLAFIITLVIFLVGQYFSMIAMTLKNPSFVIYLMVMLGLFLTIDSSLTQKTAKHSKVLMGVLAILGIYLIVGNIISLPIFNASKYQTQLVVDETADFYKDNETISFNQIPVVDRDSAMRLGDRKMGEIMDYVSQFDVSDDYTQINYHGRPVRVTPLNYSGVIKWLNNFKEGLPAYIIVDMVNQESEIIRLENKMKYSESDKFFRNIHRYLFVNYPTKMFEEISFEIDEDGIPYFVAPVYEYEIGIFGGKNIVGAVLVNAVDGSHEYYEIENVPTWLDRVYPEALVMTQLQNWGKYVNGFWNTYFGQKGMLRPTDGYNYITIDDDVYLYTGLTSVMADQSNVGFALINLRTHEAKFYNIPGAEENSAMQSAQGQVQDLKYKATFPILINSGGEPTYFMALKDSSDLVKQYAFVNVKNYNVVATGVTVAEAQKNYYQALSDNGNNVTGGDNIVEYKGKIERLQSVVVEGNSRFYMQLEGLDKTLIAPISLSDDLPLLKEGDTVKITYLETADHTVIINSIEK